MKKILLMILGVLIGIPILARDFTYEYEGQTLNYTVIDEASKTCMTKEGTYDEQRFTGTGTGANSASGNVIIPQVAKDGDTGYTVIAIGNYSFLASRVTSVTIPESVTTIGKGAFLCCTP